MPFRDRADAGSQLATRLEQFRGDDVVVLGLPRGGVPVASAVAERLGAPLDVILVRKLGLPSQPELAMGAIGEGGVRVLDRITVRRAHVTARELASVEAHEGAELAQRVQRLRHGRPLEALVGRTAIVVDDGIATGSTARAACQIARARGARRVVLAVPVAPPDRAAELARDADIDEVVCVETPADFTAVGKWYANFTQTTDDEVTACLERASATRSSATRVEHPGELPAVAPSEGAGSPPPSGLGDDRRQAHDEGGRRAREQQMHAKVGDRIVIKGHRVGETDRACEVLEVRGSDGGPPFVVRWGDDGHEGLFFPGSDASVNPPQHS
jgi:predicted phosphoribosyltransferase